MIDPPRRPDNQQTTAEYLKKVKEAFERSAFGPVAGPVLLAGRYQGHGVSWGPRSEEPR